MFKSFLEEIKNEVQKGYSKKGHPFKLLTLGTINSEQLPEQRIVVLRNSNEDLKLTFFTDLRSQKVEHIQNNPIVSAHCYHPEKRLQLTFRAKAIFEKNESVIQNLWDKLGSNNRKDYNARQIPGSFIEEPTNLEYLNHQNNFCVIHLQPTKMEYLKLNQPQHLRIVFEQKNNKWNGQFLVP